jgi:hypothetical protein
MLSLGLLIVCVIWILACGMYFLLPGLGVSPAGVNIYSGYLQVITAPVAAVICFRTYFFSFHAGDPMRTVWALVGSGLLAWGLGDILYFGYQLTHQGTDPPYPWFADIGYLTMPLLLIIALAVHKHALQVATPTWGIVLSILVLIGASGLSWWASMTQLAQADSLIAYAAQIIAIILDPALLAMTVLTASILGSGLAALPWWLGLGGLVVYYAGNLAYYILIANQGYSESHPIDLTWPIAFGMIAVAAMMTYNMFKMLED